MRYWQLIGHYNGESQNYEALAGTFQTSPYRPLVAGRLKGVRVIVSAEAATSLVEGIEFRLSCPLWKPNTMTVCAAGNGLRTVPANRQADPFDYEVDQPVDTSSDITIEGRHNVATAVTCNAFVMGLFETAGG